MQSLQEVQWLSRAVPLSAVIYRSGGLPSCDSDNLTPSPWQVGGLERYLGAFYCIFPKVAHIISVHNLDQN